MKDFRSFIYSCMKENPEDTVTCKQDLYDLFGTVDRVVKNNMALQDVEEVKAYEKLCKFRKNLLIAFFSIIIVCIIFKFGVWLINRGNEFYFYPDEEVSTSVYNEEDSTDVSVQFQP